METAVSADRTTYVSVAAIGVAATAHGITMEDGLHGMMSVAYTIVTRSVTVVLSVVRIELVLKLLCRGWGFGHVQLEVVAIFPSFGTAGVVRRRARQASLILNASCLFRGWCRPYQLLSSESPRFHAMLASTTFK